MRIHDKFGTVVDVSFYFYTRLFIYRYLYVYARISFYRILSGLFLVAAEYLKYLKYLIITLIFAQFV